MLPGFPREPIAKVLIFNIIRLRNVGFLLQGGVGCSINCRCEGCKNAFGRKDGECAPNLG